MTNFKPLTPVRFANLFDGRLGRFGVTEHVSDGTTDTARCLTDGNNWLWAYDDGDSSCFTRWAPNGAPGRILAAIEEAFDTEIVSEYNYRYWGFETLEEFRDAENKECEEGDADLYESIMKYVRGTRGHIHEDWGETAKALILKNPDLVLPEHRAKLLEAVRNGTRSKLTYTLDERDRAAIELISTHEDELPTF